MSYYIIIRGPLGCGKTTIANRLTKRLKGVHIAIDDYIEKHELLHDMENGYISQKSFIKVNKMIEPKAKELLDKGKVVIFDGNFYWESQIIDLLKRLNHPYYVFTLKAPLNICIKRDEGRKRTYGPDVARLIYRKVMSFEHGRGIDATQPINKILKEIVSFLPADKLEEITARNPFDLKITKIVPISSYNAMSGQSFHVSALGKQYKLRYCENVRAAKEMERNIRLLPHAFPHFYGRERNLLLSAWIKGKEPSKKMSTRLCYQLGKIMGEAHAMNKIEPDLDLDTYLPKKVKIIEKAKIMTKQQLSQVMDVYRQLKKKVPYQTVIEFQDVHTGNLLVSSKGKLFFVDEDGFNDSIRGSGFAKPLFRFGWLKKDTQRKAFWKGYREQYDPAFFTQEYEDFLSIPYALKTIAYRYVRGTDYSKEKVRLLDILKKYSA